MAQHHSARRQRGIGLHGLLLALFVGGLSLYVTVGALSSRAGALAQTPESSRLAFTSLTLVALSLAVVGVVIVRASAHRGGGHARQTRTQPMRFPRRPAWRLTRPDTLDALRALTPTQFELAIGDLLRRSGFRSVRHSGGAGDLAADLICHDGRGARVVVQCKRYAAGSAVTSPEMQQFIGMIYAHHHADYGIFVTTSTFTRPAVALASQHSIRLLDGVALAEQWRASGL